MKALTLENAQLVSGGNGTTWVDFDMTLPLSTFPALASAFGGEEDGSAAAAFVKSLADAGTDVNALTYTIGISFSEYN